MNEDKKKNNNDGRVVLIWILCFFLTFMSVDAFFVYKAVTTDTGVVEKIDGR